MKEVKKGALVLEIISGTLFLFAGLFLIMGFSIPIIIDLRLFISILLIVSGALIIVLSLYGIHIGSTIVLVISLCAFLIALLSPSIYMHTKYYETTYSLSINDINTSINELIILVKSSTGSVNIDFTDNESLIYRVKLYGWFFPIFGLVEPSVKYEVSNNTLYLIIDSKTLSTNILLSKRYNLELDIESSTGAVKMSGSEIKTNKLDITVSTGSIDISIENSEVNTLMAKSSTGEVKVQLINIKPSIEVGMIAITSSTGSIDLKLSNLEGIDLKASTSTGEIDVRASKDYDVFTGPKTAIVRAEPVRYIITLETSTGSISIGIE